MNSTILFLYEYPHLNDYIQMVIQSNGIAFVVTNYIELREQYYMNKNT
jgi:hypothetical protein